MSRPANGPGRYEVHFSQAVVEAVLRTRQLAQRTGRAKDVTRAMREILDRLVSRPRETGEPLYRLPSLRMELRAVVVPPIAVHFGVCEDRPVVYLKAIDLLAPPKS